MVFSTLLLSSLFLNFATSLAQTPWRNVTTIRPGRLRDASPLLPFDPNTTEYCTWYYDNDGSIPCDEMPGVWAISLETFRRWVSLDNDHFLQDRDADNLQNPSISATCSGFETGKSYCVEAMFEPPPVTSTAIPTSIIPSTSTTVSKPAVTVTSSTLSTAISKTSAIASSTTSPGNGIATPQPTQPGMVANCAKFHWIAKGVTCSQVISYQKITLEEFVKWNPTVLSDCSGMWAEVQVCVGVIASSTTTKPTTTAPSNGIETPQPTQPGMVTNCNKFHWIAPGVSCSQVTSFQKISLADFVKWNPTVGNDCSTMQGNVQVCVGVIGGSTPTTTTTAGNGVSTPQPTQPGMVTNCAKFHWITSGVVCSQVTSFQKISLADFVKWNPTVKDDCTGMQANVNVCVGIIRGATTPPPTTTTSAGNGIQTPQPTQPGMVTNCKKFHYVETGVVCSQLTSFNHISLADFVKWNPGVGSDCSTMWAKTYFCVGV